MQPENNVPPSVLQSRLTDFFKAYSHRYECLIWRMLLQKEEDSLCHRRGEITPIAKGHKIPEERYWDYGEWVLLCLRIENQAFLENLNHLLQETTEKYYEIDLTKLTVASPVKTIKFYYQPNFYKIEYISDFHQQTRSWNEDRNWPHYLVTTSSPSNFKVKDLVNLESPYFKDERQIYHLFFELKKNYTLDGSFQISLPTFECRFRDVQITLNQVEIEIQHGPDPLDSLYLAGVGEIGAEFKDHVITPTVIPTSEPTLVLKKSPTIKRLDLVIFDSVTNRTITTYPTYQISLPEDIIPTLEGMYEAAKRGESSNLEYKEKYKSKDIAKELCAFANAEGGTVLVGIDDDGRVKGVKEQISDVKDWLQQTIDKNLEPPITFTIEEVEISEDKQIIIIYTPPSQVKPVYSRDKEGIYVRAQGTSRPATRDEIIELARTY
ncbi:MAG: helix-turn-helix domain-containing protein [Promethearchaeota archaeon]